MKYWKTKDGYIKLNESGFCYVGETANKIMHTINKKERELPKNLKSCADEIREAVLSKILSNN